MFYAFIQFYSISLPLPMALPLHPVVGFFGFTLCVPLDMGYRGRSFLEAVLTGILVPAGFGFGLFAWKPIENLVLNAIIVGGLALPVAGFMFVLGVALRGDYMLRDRKRRLAVGMLVALLIAGVCAFVVATNTVSMGGDQ